MRIVEILVAVNAACGIAAFLLARGAIRRVKKELGFDQPESATETGRRAVEDRAEDLRRL